MITGNNANQGGGLFLQSDVAMAATIESSLIADNEADAGGGLGVNSGAMDSSVGLRNATLSGNRAATMGGGLAVAGHIFLHNSTITANTSGNQGGGVALIDATSAATLISTLVVDNSDASNSGPDLLGPATATASLIGDNTGVLLDASSDGNIVGTLLAPVDARLKPLSDNGGPTLTHALEWDSPALDAGLNSSSLITDQRGAGFLRTVGLGTDIGAYEHEAPPLDLVVSTFADAPLFLDPITGELDFRFEFLTLREALALSDTSAGPARIQFDPLLTVDGDRAISVTSIGDEEFGPSAYRIGRQVTLVGPTGADGILLEIDSEFNPMRFFHVDPQGSLTLENITLTGGLARGFDGADSGPGGAGGGAAGMGGAIYNQGRLTLRNSTLTANQAEGGDGGNSNQTLLRAGGGGGGLLGPGDAPFGDAATNGGEGGGGEGGAFNGGPFAGAGGIGGQATNFGAGGGGGGPGTSAGGPGGAGSFGGGGGGGGEGATTGGRGGNSIFGGGGTGGQGAFGQEGLGGSSSAGGRGGDGIFAAAGGAGGGGAGLGGAIFNDQGTVMLVNSTLFGNTARGGDGGFDGEFSSGGQGAGAGGGVFNRDGEVTIIHGTLAGNRVLFGAGVSGGARDGGAIYNFDSGNAGAAKITLVNSVLADTSDANTDAVNDGGTVIAGPENIVERPGSGRAHQTSWSGDTRTGDPRLSNALADNGGPTRTLTLLPGSPALDTAADSPLVPIQDQRGLSRSEDGDADGSDAPDVGALELLTRITVNDPSDEVDGDPFNGLTTLREALTIPSVTLIEFDASLNGTTIELGETLAVTRSLAIAGPGADQLTIDGGGRRVFQIDDGVADALSNVELSGLKITGGNADRGGGILTRESLSLTAVFVTGNSATGDGGGLLVDAAGGVVSILGSSFTDNAAERGGAIHLAGQDYAFTTRNTTVSGNSAAIQGGGLSMDPAAGLDVQISQSTITDNQSPRGGGIAAEAAPEYFLRHSIVAGNLGGPDLNGTVSVTATLLGDASDAAVTEQDANNILGSSVSPIEPRLGPLQNNGGSTPTHLLLIDSPALDAAEADGSSERDQRGRQRVQDADGDGVARVDLGAVEMLGAVTVNDRGDGNDGDLANGLTTLREALASDALAIVIADDSDAPIELMEGPLLVDRSVAIRAASFVEIRGGSSGGVFDIGDDDAANQSRVELANLAAAGGNAEVGGGIRNRGEHVTLVNVQVSDNRAEFGGGVANEFGGTMFIRDSRIGQNVSFASGLLGGGGVLNLGAMEVHDSNLFGNSAVRRGGGIQNVSEGEGPASLLIRDSVVHDNRLTDQFGVTVGGGVDNLGMFGPATVSVENSTVSGNAAGQGGGIAAGGVDSHVSLTHVTVANNLADRSGGGLFNADGGGPFQVRRSIVADNQSPEAPDARGDFLENEENLVGDTTGSNLRGISDVVHVDLSSFLNADVVINNGGAEQPNDTQQDGPDTESYLTASAAAARGAPAALGLPDGGVILAGAADMPFDVPLHYDNDDDGDNAIMLTFSSPDVSITLAPNEVRAYHTLLVFASAAGDEDRLEIEVGYSDGSSDLASLVVDDWFDDVSEGTAAVGQEYLIDGLARARGDSQSGFNPPGGDPGIFALEMSVDRAKTIDAICLRRTEDSTSVVIFGISLLALPLADLGPFDGTIHPLGIDSDAIDRVGLEPAFVLDQRGLERTDGDNDGLAIADLGAAEHEPVIVVDTLEDVVAVDGLCSLREAIQAANLDAASGPAAFFGECIAGAGADTIQFSGDLDDGGAGGVTINLVDGQLLIESPITLLGFGADRLAISGAGQSRIFQVGVDSEGVSISRLTIANGIADFGGALLNQGQLTLDAVAIRDSQATGFAGGGIFNDSLGNLTILRSEIAGNAGTVGDGGGIFNLGALTVENSTISGNAATFAGGGIGMTEGTAVLRGSTVTANRSNSDGLDFPDAGGGLAQFGNSTLTLSNTLVAGNFSVRPGQDVPADIVGLVTADSTHNLIGSSVDLMGIVDGENGNRIGTEQAVIDPLVGELDFHGGTTRTHAILSASPARDAGQTTLPVDQRGVARPQGAAPDVGAFEQEVLALPPELLVFDAIGAEDSPVPLNIIATLQTTDGSESLSVRLEGIPDGAVVSAGVPQADGSVSLTRQELNGLTVTPPPHVADPFTIGVTATASRGGDASSTASLAVQVLGRADEPTLSVVPAIIGATGEPIPLSIASSLRDLDGSESLEITLIDAPPGSSLSAGDDLGDGSFSLTAEQLDGIALTTPTAGSFTLGVIATASEFSPDGKLLDTASVSAELEVLDNDPGFVILETDGATVVDADGTTDTFSVGVLNTPPTTDVVVEVIASTATLVATFDPARLTFTPQNFAQPQIVTVVPAASITDGDVQVLNIAPNTTLSDPLFPAQTGSVVVTAVVRGPRVGDFNEDGLVNAADADLLYAAISTADTGPQFDLDADGELDADDFTRLIEVLFDSPTRRGDANLDGRVDFSDFLALSANFGQPAARWDNGDFDVDGLVAFADFLLLAENFGFDATVTTMPVSTSPPRNVDG